ncbi:DUF418 domain-containing protein [Mucilaginibacter xinganensis]|uniref:DUF418 domain-containing protein n=1 Tax=Mucilaginibacter xinganensis TaxID=1234841 RepID=A0A223NUC1_9SPHI|nr:DUF418 domain-containing protein [Mucilaginibacter xinganensis]ASU33472.1 hypothetical protein MuYL_1574 [Mucilaginibacter xinganensis]
MTLTDFAPVSFNKRVPIVDMLRGWALLGVVLMNYSDFFSMGAPDNYKPDVFNNILLTGGSILFASKSWTLLSFLFGYGFAVLMQNTANKGIDTNSFFLKRMFWLFVIAFFNSMFFFGDILKDYAFLGIILLMFQKCSVKTSLYIAALLFLLIPLVTSLVINFTGPASFGILAPYFPLYKSHSLLQIFWFGLLGTWKGQVINLNCTGTVHTVMFCCFMMGLAAKKAAFFENIMVNKRAVIKIWAVSLALLIVIIILNLSLRKPALIAKYYNPDYWVVLVTMTFTTASLCWLYVAGALKTFFAAMQSIGKMTLTNYIMQNVISIFLFSGFGFGLALTQRIAAVWYYLIALLVYVLQVYLSKWWLKYNYYGPVEWLWRQLSYGKRLGIKIKN